MAVFPSKKYRPASHANTLPARYRVALNKHPFALFGLPFLATVLLGSFFLTPATALRYERHDNKVKQVSAEDKLGFSQNRRKVDMKEEYYRLSAKDLDNWEQKRVKRLPGEPDGII